MKLNVILFVTIALVPFIYGAEPRKGLGNGIENFERNLERQTRIFENQIREEIEKLRKQLKDEGIPALHISSLDPLVVKDRRIQLDNKIIDMDLNVTADVKGLLGFEITKLKVAIIGLKFTMEIKFPEVTATGKYQVNASTSLAPVVVFGDGNVDATARGFNLLLTGSLTTKFIDGKLKVLLKELKENMALPEFKIDITGIYNDADLSKMISDGLSGAVPKIIDNSSDEVNKALVYVVKIVNDWLSNHDISFPI